MAVCPQHLPRCLAWSPTTQMFRVVTNQLRHLTWRDAKAYPMIFNLVADGVHDYSRSNHIMQGMLGDAEAIPMMSNDVADCVDV